MVLSMQDGLTGCASCSDVDWHINDLHTRLHVHLQLRTCTVRAHTC